MFVKHEDLATDPLEGFEKLYHYCSLTWSDKTKSIIVAHTNANNVKEVPSDDPDTIRRDSRATIKTWKHRLTQGEIERIYEGTHEIAALFYKQVEWE